MELTKSFHRPFWQTPSLKDLIHCVDKRRGSQSGPSLSDAAEKFRIFVDSTEVRDILNDELRQVSLNPKYLMAGGANTTALLAESDSFALTLSLVDAGSYQANRLYSNPADAWMAVLAPAPVVVATHRIPERCNLEQFDASMTLLRGSPRKLEPRIPLFLESASDVLETIVDQPTLLVKLSLKVCQSLIWAYDRTTLAPVMVSGSSAFASRLQSASILLRVLANELETPDDSYSDVLVDLCRHRFHYVRWAALQNLSALDFEKALPLLEVAQDDDHPHVRRAARSSIARLGLAAMAAKG